METQGAIVITGANGGIGQYVTQYLLSRGERNIICQYRSGDGRVRSVLESHGLDPKLHSVQADLTDETSVQKMGVFVRERFSSTDGLINVAGSSSNGMSWKLSRESFVKVVNDSLLSTFLCTREFTPEMREKNFGRIINLSSIVGFTGIAGAAHYAAAKAGIVGYTKSVAQEVANKGITCNALALGYFDTGLIESVPSEMQHALQERIPAGRFGKMEDVGSAVAYLLSRESQFFTGQVIHLNGGQY